MDGGGWTSLEVVKLIISLMTPLVLAGIGVYVHRITKKFEHAQWRGQKLIEKRLSVYDDLAPLFNDLLCYFTYVGGWRDQKPADIVALKRVIDKKIYLAAPLFSSEFFKVCIEFQRLCFDAYNGLGVDAQLRTGHLRRKECWKGIWSDEWNGFFSNDKSEATAIEAAYVELMEVFSREIGVVSEPRPVEVKHATEWRG
jgi:hypothetical protein